MKVLFDTCVIVDVLQNRTPYVSAGQSLFIAVANRQIDAYITAKSLTDIYYLTHRHTHDDAETRKILTKLLCLFGMLDTAALDCQSALFSEMTDYEDAVMSATAVRSGMDCIVTRNTKDYVKAQISICAPEELLKRIEEDSQSEQ